MKNNLKFYKTFLLTILVVLISSCLTNVDEEEVLDPDALDPCVDITFSVDVKKIIDNNISKMYRPKDLNRDQTYFLFATTQEQLNYLHLSFYLLLLLLGIVFTRVPEGEYIRKAIAFNLLMLLY